VQAGARCDRAENIVSVLLSTSFKLYCPMEGRLLQEIAMAHNQQCCPASLTHANQWTPLVRSSVLAVLATLLSETSLGSATERLYGIRQT
jgi:hypothetical protein